MSLDPSDARDTWPAAERNKQPILEVLARLVPEGARLLELASGTGQHAAYFAERLPLASYQPSDMDESHHPSIGAWTAGLDNVLPVVALDATSDPWPLGEQARYEIIYNANMIHIAPWEVCLGLFRGAGRHLSDAGLLVLYGPFKLAGAHTAESNAEFDVRLRERNPSWGVRDLDEVERVAGEHGLRRRERVAMPANNQLVVFERG